MNPKMAFDIGMNNGDDTAYYLHKGFQVVAVEANPQLVEKATLRFQAELASRQLVILNVGIAGKEGSLPFWVCDEHSEWSSFDRNSAARDGCAHHEILVPCRRFQSIIEEFGAPYYLKVDIEGNDRLCLDDLRNDNLPKYISVEAADLALLDSLAELGYTRFKCLSQFLFMTMEIPYSREHRSYEFAERWLKSRSFFVRIFRRMGGRKYLDGLKIRSRRDDSWIFPEGSSGPFGDGLPGRWLDREEARKAFKTFQKMMQDGQRSPFWTDKGHSFWVDFHATK